MFKFFFYFLMASTLHAASYFIDPVHGDDANPAGKPWRSFAKLNAQRLAPGDTVVIAPGRQEETFKPLGEGTLQNPVRIQFLPGVHVIGSQHVIRLPMFVSNSMSSDDPKPVGMLLQNVRHFRIEGGGVDGPGKTTILCDGRMVQIFNDHAEDVTFTGLVFDLKRPTVSEFRVLEAGPTHAVIQVAEGSDYAVENGKFAWKGDWGTIACIAQEAIPGEGRCWRLKELPLGWNGQGQSVATATDLGGGKVRLDYGARKNGLVQGHQYQFRNALRDRVGVHNARSKDIVFRDCDFHALTGMGFVSQFTENIIYQRVNVAPPKGTLRTCAAWADIFQFSNCRGDILVDSCRLSGMQDDAINCHGTHLRIIGKIGDNQFLMRFMHRETYGFAVFQPGDEVAVISHLNLREYSGNPRRKVTAVERKSDRDWLLTLDGPAPAFEKDDVLDNITWYPNLTARNNHISMDPVRGFLLTTRGKVVIEGNTFHRCAMAAILIEDDAEGWFESGPVRDMLIRGNTFISCGISINPQTKSSKPEEPVHENIRIVDNVFEGESGISTKNVKGLIVTGNRSTKGPLEVKLAPSCSETKVEGNGEYDPASTYRLPAGELTNRAEQVVYKKTPQGDLRLYLLRPPGRQARPLPAIVYFTGGGWVNGTPDGMIANAAWFRDHGIIGIAADYRVKNRHGTTPLECVRDGKSAIRYIRAHASELGVDPDRIIAAGGSAGGHVAAATVLPGNDEPGEDATVSSRPNALVLHNPVLGAGFGNEFFAAHPDCSPLAGVCAGWPPTVLSCGTADHTTPYAAAEQFVGKMRLAGNACELIPVTNADHSCDWPVTNLNFLPTVERMLEFLRAQKVITGGE